MSQWVDLRREAQNWHEVLSAEANGVRSAEALLEAAQRLTGIPCHGCAAGDPLLCGAEAFYDPDEGDFGAIYFDADADPGMVAFYRMHEYAHHKRHSRSGCSAAAPDPEASEEDAAYGIARVEGYGPEERAEREANVFAREVLLPTPVLRRWYIEEGLGAPEIAERVGVAEGMVYHQLAYALLVGDLPVVGPEESGADPVGLDESQRDAAQWNAGPLLVEAGPGTGKTRTLVGRIEYLLQKGVDANSILALTFSNKAAEEMRERVGRSMPEAAERIWAGTFHAFGLELLRKHGGLLGLPPRLDVLDPVDGLLVLERALPTLGLDWYQNLYEPTMHLRSILGAISRAKDELVGPDRYQELAEGMLAVAQGDAGVEAAEKALEVARVYAHYQRHLEDNHLLDFGDLIAKSVVLLREHEPARTDVRRTYRHVLVDEYQDVNRASGILLREIAGDGAHLWVVGDSRQSIYRFRGASPSNIRRFAEDFPGAFRRPLSTNYRSRPEIVRIFEAFAPRMHAAAGRPFEGWHAHRSSRGGTITVGVAEDLDGEVDGIAAQINRLQREGVPLRKQAVLCRSHTTLARIAARLEGNDVRVLYLGDLFERPEIRDLLSLLGLACEGDGRALLRVARFPEYQIPLADVRVLLTAAREQHIPFPRALRLGASVEGLSQQGRERLAKLSVHLDGLCYGTQAWRMLVEYLFARSDYLRPFVGDATTIGLQRRLAIYQFLEFAHGLRGAMSKTGEDPKRSFLTHVRRLEMFDEEKQLRQVPQWAAGIDAVRLLTVHASKGLEFDAVFIPVLGQGYFPLRRQGITCPPPAGMLDADPATDHDEEEECLLFVALSRARESLCLSRAGRYGASNSKASKTLLSIAALPSVAPLLSHRPDGETNWQSPPSARAPAPADTGVAEESFGVSDLDLYISCPRKYFYEKVIGLSGYRKDSAYVRFHRCVYAVLRWMYEQRAAGVRVDLKAAVAQLDVTWAGYGPADHPYESLYRASAARMLAVAVSRLSDHRTAEDRPVWEVSLSNGRVRLQPDHVERVGTSYGTQRSVYRLRTGKPSKSETQKDIYALYLLAVEQEYGAALPVEVLFLSTGETQPVTLTVRARRTRIERYEGAIAGILQREYPPNPSDRTCPRCPHYFICPLAEDAVAVPA